MGRAQEWDELRRQALSQMMPHWCHKLGNDLNVVLGLSSMLGDDDWGGGDLGAEERRALVSHAERGSNLLRRVAEFCVEAEEEIHGADLDPLIEGVHALLVPLTSPARAELSLSPLRTAAHARCDERRVLQLLVVLGAELFPPEVRANPERRLRLTARPCREGAQIVLVDWWGSSAMPEVYATEGVGQALVGTDVPGLHSSEARLDLSLGAGRARWRLALPPL